MFDNPFALRPYGSDGSPEEKHAVQMAKNKANEKNDAQNQPLETSPQSKTKLDMGQLAALIKKVKEIKGIPPFDDKERYQQWQQNFEEKLQKSKISLPLDQEST